MKRSVVGAWLDVLSVQARSKEAEREMKAKGQEEMAKEKAMFEEYQAWCKEVDHEKSFAIRTGGEAVEKLEAAKVKADADTTALNDAVAELDAAIAQAMADKKASTEVREKERADYEKLHADYSESISSTSDAIRKIESNPVNIGNALIQLPTKTQQAIAALQAGTEGIAEDQAGAAFQSSSGGILETINLMKSDISDQRAKAEQEEAKARNSYQLIQQELTMSISHMTDERDAKTAKSAQRQQDAAESGGDAVATQATKEEDEKYLAEVQATCETKAADFVSRQELRAEELKAIQQAIDIIGSKSVAGKADKHLPKLMQTSFALRASATMRAKTTHVFEFLQDRAQRTSSKYLARAAAASRDGPFDKVVGMIKAMIMKLTEEAGEEAEHKAWCDGELQANKQTRDAKTSEVNSLTALIEKTNAEIAKLGEEAAALTEAIATLDAALSEATATRAKEKAENTEAVADAKEAQTAVKAALKVLKAFYKKAAAATAFTQTSQPAIFDKAYKGMGGSSTGVLGMLDVILSDFVRLEEETSTEEADAQRTFDEFASETTADKNAKAATLDGKEKASVAKKKALSQAERDLKATQTELDAAMTYYDKLKPSCLDAGVDFEERTARREEEIASLQEALKLLD